MSQQITELLRKGDSHELRQALLKLPIADAFKVCHTAMKDLSPDERYELWHSVRTSDKFAGVLCVAELRMPQHLVFGSQEMPRGDTLTDYDHARTFILQHRDPGPRITGSFYPEFMRLPPKERIIRLAKAHIGCTPTGQKQANLFSLCGKYDYKTAQKKTQPAGTTCALFLRAILRAAGDARMTDDMLPERANMLSALGLKNKNSAVLKEESKHAWIESYTKQTINRMPQRGDLYYIIIPGVLFRKAGDPIVKDSGHVGIITNVAATRSHLTLTTIDGGQGKPGYRTTSGPRSFQRTFVKKREVWEQTSKPSVKGQLRILAGFVNLDQVISSFRSKYFRMLDGRTIRHEL